MQRARRAYALAALLALGGLAPAIAADLPVRSAPPVYVPPPLPVFSWTGLYIGGQAGYAFGEDHGVNPGNAPAGRTSHPSGFIGGGHVGYNFAGIPGLAAGIGGLVVGLEGDIDGSTYRDTYGVTAVATMRNDIQGSVRGRIGYAVDRVLFYATGGAAFATFHDEFRNPTLAAFSTSRVGYTVGGGVEYGITNQWSVRAEYRYSDFGSYREFPNGTPVTKRETIQRVQGGVSYRFETIAPAPVVARY